MYIYTVSKIIKYLCVYNDLKKNDASISAFADALPVISPFSPRIIPHYITYVSLNLYFIVFDGV